MPSAHATTMLFSVWHLPLPIEGNTVVAATICCTEMRLIYSLVRSGDAKTSRSLLKRIFRFFAWASCTCPYKLTIHVATNTASFAFIHFRESAEPMPIFLAVGLRFSICEGRIVIQCAASNTIVWFIRESNSSPSVVTTNYCSSRNFYLQCGLFVGATIVILDPMASIGNPVPKLFFLCNHYIACGINIRLFWSRTFTS